MTRPVVSGSRNYFERVEAVCIPRQEVVVALPVVSNGFLP
jgi:hypothetical protein